DTTSGVTNLFDEQSYDAAEAIVAKDYKKLGDLGAVAEEVITKANHRHTQLSISEVYDQLMAIAEDHGAGSQERKLEGLVTLLRSAEAISAKFIVRIIMGRLRLGFSTMTMIDALSWAMTGTKEESKLLESAYQKKAD